jgi:hypothetical protein
MMRRELDKRLVEAFPLLYRDRYKQPEETAMCWGFPGDGWYKIIYDLSAKLEAHARDQKTQKMGDNAIVRAAQVKEKFGALCFYVHGDIPDKLKLSATVCHDCGKEGKLRNDRSWVLTLCDECNEKDY